MKQHRSGKETLSQQLLRLRAKASWTWARMCREFHRVMGHEGPSQSTLFRYAGGKVKRSNVLAERYVQQALHKLTDELSQKSYSPKQNRINPESRCVDVQMGGDS